MSCLSVCPAEDKRRHSPVAKRKQDVSIRKEIFDGKFQVSFAPAGKAEHLFNRRTELPNVLLSHMFKLVPYFFQKERVKEENICCRLLTPMSNLPATSTVTTVSFSCPQLNGE